MFVAASTACFGNLSLHEALEKLVDLEFSAIDLAVNEELDHLKPSSVLADFEGAIAICNDTKRLDIIAFNTEISATGDEHYEQFDAICRLAKATRVVTITVPSGPIGTPFNEEVEHLRRLVDLATLQGVRVSILTQAERLSEDPDTAIVLCDNVKGLGVTLDPSAFVYGPGRGRNYTKLMKYIHHLHLRDTSKDAYQVRVGQGEVEYGRLVALLEQQNYNRALAVHVTELPDIEHFGEMRKMRLLLESLL